MSSTAPQLETHCRLPHRLAVLLACATFPLIWVGGLVTTYDAGMAVPDWPTTYGYNLFLYPWQTWLFGPWDLFIEHGHRLLGAVVGMLTIALAAAIWMRDSRHWMRWLGLAAVAGVVFQGVLGGLRVRLDERLLAQIHGCIGPAFFALSAALAVLTSRRWRAPADLKIADRGGAVRLSFVATSTAVLAYVQLLLGSQLRHMPVTADATMFRLAVVFHLIVAAVLAAHVFITWRRAEREAASNGWLVRPARGLAALIAVQLALGAGAWVVNYGWPAWLSSYGWAAGFVVTREGFGQAIVTTAHVAVGSLILATSVVLALRSWKVAAELSGAGRGATSVGNALSGSPQVPRGDADRNARNGTESVPYRTPGAGQLIHKVVVA